MNSAWRPAVRAIGAAAGTGPHTLRHRYASLLIAHGEDVRTVSERLGHTNMAMTLNRYTHLFPDREDRSREAVDRAYRQTRFEDHADSVRTDDVG